MIDNTSLLLQVIGLLTIIAETSGSGGGSGGAVTVDNFPTDYSLETTQQTSISTLADILTELQSLVTNTTSPLSVTETTPITGFNLEATQQDVLTQLQDLTTVIKNSKDYELSIFVDENESTGVPEYIIYRETLYNSDTDSYIDSYYKLDYQGVKTPFDVVSANSLVPVESYIIDYFATLESLLSLNRDIFVDRSNTIAAPNTSQQVMAVWSPRKYFLVQNISDTDMYINFNGPANIGLGSIKLVPNGSYELSRASGGYINTSTINIICSVAGKAYTAKEVL